jgi:hypothetical protein
MADRALTDLELERWLAGDLPDDRTRAATADDRARLEQLRAEHAGFLASVDVGDELRAIRRRAEHLPGRRASRRIWLAAGGALAAAALAILVVRHPGSAGPDAGPDDDPDDTRVKGGSVGLVVHVATGAGSRAIAGEGPVHAGDRIRFEVSAPRAGYVAVIGLDPSGRSTVYYPFGGAAPARLDAGAGPVLPGAIELDAAEGDEHVVAVYAEQPFALDADLISALRSGIARPMLRGGSAGVPGLAVARVLLHRTK